MALALYGFVAPKRRIEPAGISYEFSLIKDRLTLGLSTLPVLRIAQTGKNGTTDPSRREVTEEEAELLEEPVENWMDKEDAKYRKYIGKLDPNNWKEQDHYKVLGLSKLRYQASPAQIKIAYRRKVLIYHPDKGKADHDDKDIRNEAIFACIQKAYEQLGLSEERRRAYDSVDPGFDENVPETVDASDFYSVLGPVFCRNARFSVNQPVPFLGDENSDRSHVEHFYEFWFDWRSWREFSYLDSEDKSKGEDRWERREIEKMNKFEREKRRKKDLKRISNLVEMAYSKDPRVIKFKEEDKQKKEAMKVQRKREREMREQKEQEERRREEEAEEQKRKEQKEEQRVATQERQKKKKEMASQRRRLRELAAEYNYWVDNKRTDEKGINNHYHQSTMAVMEKIERICLTASFDELNSICDRLASLKNADDEAVKLLNECAGRDETKNGNATTTANGEENSTNKKEATTAASGKWSNEELQLLVKAVNLYPPGTQERWRQVADYINDHHHGGKMQRTERDVIKQVKLLKSETASSGATTQNKQQNPVAKPETETSSECAKTTGEKTKMDEGGWSSEQQKQLERALKETPAGDPERWDKIAALVEGRSKKECIRRYKQLSEMVKQAKAQQQ